MEPQARNSREDFDYGLEALYQGLCIGVTHFMGSLLRVVVG